MRLWAISEIVDLWLELKLMELSLLLESNPMDRMPSMDPNTSTQELADSTRLGSKPTWLHLTKKLPLKVAVHSQVTMETMAVAMKVVMMATTIMNAKLNATVTTTTRSVGMLATNALMMLTAQMTKETTMVEKVDMVLTANANVITMMSSAGMIAYNAGMTTTKRTMMVLMRVVMKVEMMVKSLASTAHASVNMKTWLAGKSAMSASRLTSVATMPTREMILTKEITEKMKVRSMAVNASMNASVSTMMKNVGKTAITAGRKFTQKTMKVKRVKAKTMVAMTWCASKSVNVTMTTKSVGTLATNA